VLSQFVRCEHFHWNTRVQNYKVQFSSHAVNQALVFRVMGLLFKITAWVIGVVVGDWC